MSAETEVAGRSRLQWLNPVLVKELKERVRSPRAAVILTIYLVLLGVVLYMVYRIELAVSGAQNLNSSQLTAPAIGRLMFESVVFCLIFLIAFIAPGLAAAAVAAERERRTLHLLQLTLLTPRSIVLGKLGASLSFVLLLIAASVPLLSIPLVIGGFSVGDVLKVIAMLIAISTLICAVGVCISSLAKRVQFASVAAYGVVLIYFIGTLFAWAAEEATRDRTAVASRQRAVSVFLNPLTATASAVYQPGGRQDSPLSGLGSAVEKDDFVSGVISSSNGIPQVSRTPRPHRIRVWMVHLLLIAVVTFLALGFAIRQVSAPRHDYTLG